MMRTKFLYIIIVFFLFIDSCKVPLFHNQGIIEYSIDYLENNTENISTNHLPRKMILKFKNNLSMNKIEGFMGLFSISNISDSKKETNTTLLKILDNKYCYNGAKNEYACCFEPFDSMKVETTNEYKIIAGYNCRKALITFNQTKVPVFEVYYTREIKINKPNLTNPYKSINGVLMEFYLYTTFLKMRLTAEEVRYARLSNEEFIIPSDYKNISRDKMEEIFLALLE